MRINGEFVFSRGKNSRVCKIFSAFDSQMFIRCKTTSSITFPRSGEIEYFFVKHAPSGMIQLRLNV